MSSPVPPDPVVIYDEITAKVRDALFTEAALYLNQTDLALMEKACAYAFRAHDGQKRRSGEPYITHPIEVTLELARWRMDVQTLCAGLMHDVLEDTEITEAQMAAEFGSTITKMVVSLTKLEDEEKKDKSELQASNLRRLVVSMLNEPRVIVVKLSDRLHNMRTISAQRAESKMRSAMETFNVYAPIADFLGLSEVHRELQDLSFAALYPFRYRALANNMEKFRAERKAFIDGFMDKIRDLLSEHHIHAEVYGRERSLYSIYQKHKNNRKGRFEDWRDVYGFRVIVDSVDECYLALGILHRHYPPQLNKFKDYIALPKSNGYQSLHTSLRVTNALHPLKVQIRTKEMNSKAEKGFISDIVAGSSADVHHIQVLLEEIRQLDKDSEDDRDFVNNITADFGAKFFVYTPKGKAIPLSRGATPIDFAYAIHSEVGNRCAGALVNRRRVSLNTKLNADDCVQIITSPTAHPTPEWLNMAVTGNARSKIRVYLNRVSRNDALDLGRQVFEHVLNSIARHHQLNPETLAKQFEQKYLNEKRTWDKFYEEVARLQVSPAKIALGLERLFQRSSDEENVQLDAFAISGRENSHIHFASCCYPVPQDNISMLFDQKSGFVIHREDCAQLLNEGNEKNILKATWRDFSDLVKQHYLSRLQIIAHDGQGLLAQILSTIAEKGINLVSIHSENIEGSNGVQKINLLLEVHHLNELTEVMTKLNNNPKIQEVVRS